MSEALIGVIIGGIIGVIGTIVGPPLAHWLRESSEKKKHRAAKFEEMVNLIYEHHAWLERMRNAHAFGKLEIEQTSPLPKAQSIAAIYFPQFNLRLSELDLKASEHVMWAMGAGLKRMEGNASTMKEGLNESYEPYLDKFTELVRELKTFAAKEFR